MRKVLSLLIILAIFTAMLFIVKAEDTDGDSLDDPWEIRYFNNLSQPRYGDPDKDALSNYLEYQIGSNPANNDSDSDGWGDQSEYLYGTNLTERNSFPTTSLVTISLISPRYGVSKVTPFDLIIRTSNESECKYSLSKAERYDTIDAQAQKFTTSDFYTHDIKKFPLATSFETPIYVFCKTKFGYMNDDFPKEIILSVDSSEPSITYSGATPEFVIEKLEVVLRADTDDKSVCKFVPSNTNISALKNLFNDTKIDEFRTSNSVTLNKLSKPPIEDNKVYSFYSLCMNKAELVSLSSVNFRVNLSVPNKIIEKRPSGYLKSTKYELKVVTNKESTCRFGEGYLNMFPQIGFEHFIQRENYTEGLNRIPVMCLFNDATVINDVVEFTYDSTGPTITSLTAPLESCITNMTYVQFSSGDADVSNYTIKFFDMQNRQMFYLVNNTNGVDLSNLSLARGQKYTWEVYATDNSGNNGTSKRTAGTSILAEESETCLQNRPPVVGYEAKLTTQGIKLLLTCKDDGGPCASTGYGLMDPAGSICKDCETCTHQRYLSTTSILITNETTVCYNVTDGKKKSALGGLDISFGTCTSNATCCLEKQGTVCSGTNCTIVASVECAIDKLDSDGDGILDLDEAACGLNPNNRSDAALDTDGDNLKDIDECMKTKTDREKKDSDGDGTDDDVEIKKSTNPNDPDSFPKEPIPDPPKVDDTDGDGIDDEDEIDCGLDPDKDDAGDDADGDTFSNEDECLRYGTKWDEADSDSDGYADNVEDEKGTDPTDPEEFPKSHTLNTILFILGVPMLAAGAYLLIKDMPRSTGSIPRGQSSTGRSSFVDFSRAKKDMATSPQQPIYQQPRENEEERELDMDIKRKREELRFKQMSSVFDEFSDGNRGQAANRPQQRTPQQASRVNNPFSGQQGQEFNQATQAPSEEKVFNRLDNISKEDAFEDIERIKRRKNV